MPESPANEREEHLAAIAHELRTPLSVASAGIGMLEQSLDDRLRPDERRLVSRVRRNVERLRWQIDDLIRLLQSDAESSLAERQPLDLKSPGEHADDD